MFTRMQKYHKTFLIAITVVIAASFGMGSVFMNLSDARGTATAGTYGTKPSKITQNEYRHAYERWNNFFKFAESISPKAQRIQKVAPGEDPQVYRQLFGMENPVWDAIYSLREEVVALDQKVDEQLNHPMKWKSLLEGTMDFLLPGAPIYPPRLEELEVYHSLTPQEREKVAKPLTKNNVWTFFLLLAQAKQWGIEVSDSEVNDFILLTQNAFRSPSDFMERIKSHKLHETLDHTAKEALTILKYLRARNSEVKITTQAVYETYSRYHTKHSIAWIQADYKKFADSDEQNYRKQQLAFFQETSKSNPDYFKMNAIADFEYLALKAADLASTVKIEKDEIDKEYAEQKKTQKKQDDEDLDDAQLDKKVKEEEAKIETKLRIQKANQKAFSIIEEIRAKIVALGGSAKLEELASQYTVEYQNKKNVSERNFFEKDANAPQNAAEGIYKNWKEGEISPVLSSASSEFKTYYCLRLVARTPEKHLTQADIEKDENLFLESYYHQNRSKFTTPKTYRLAYVVCNYEDISKNLIVTTNAMKEFYEEYKDQLYKVEAKDQKPSYKPFEEVREDLEKRVANFIKIKELQKVHIVHKLCKEKGADANLSVLVNELARQIMLSPQTLSYIEENRLMTGDDIRAKNPTGDPDFPGNLDTKETLSEVKDSAHGKYFYKILATEEEQTPEFAKIPAQVKDEFIKAQALEKGRLEMASWKKEYDRQYQLAKTNIEKTYDARILALWNQKNEAAPEQKQKLDQESNLLTAEKQQKLASLPTEIFQALALVHGMEVKKSASFEAIEEVQELKSVPGVEMVLTLKVGEVNAPLLDEQKADIYLIALSEKIAPALSEVPSIMQERIRKILMARAYRSRLTPFLSHRMIAREMSLEIKDDDLTEEEEEMPESVQ